ncbi:MAG: hypothetical protein GKR90_10930 [Pseudomonadales bacterium]|nr:hypothetical protein [Pseudomonadales bacterium]
MKRFLLFWSIVVAAIVLPQAYAAPHAGIQGFVVAAEYRFHPSVQRLMAERELRALPLQNGKLYYVFPMTAGNSVYLEQMQLQNLERLIDKTSELKDPVDEEVQAGPERAASKGQPE